MSEIVERARIYATQAHQRIDQRRKYSNQPYHVHLEAVAKLVATISDDDEMISAAWLHDVVEDTPATLDDMEQEFGGKIAQLVKQLTDVSLPSDGNRSVRKSIDRAHIAKASARAKTIKLADLIDNCKDITKHDHRFALVYLEEMHALLDVLSEGDPKLYKQAGELHAECVVKVNKANEQGSNTQPVDSSNEFFSTVPRQHFRRMFAELFTAKDLAEPLLSFDADKSTEEVSKALTLYQQQVASIRVHGAVRGYIQTDDISANEQPFSAEVLRHFDNDQVIDGDSLISDVIHVLTIHNYCFVRILGDVVGYIDRNAINKPIVRMWLFGIITLVEMRLVDMIQNIFPDENWHSMVPENRLEKAKQLQNERIRRKQQCKLIDCLQLSDKAQILLSHEPTFEAMGFRSKKAAKQVVKEIEQLRNHLAHSQDDIAQHNWAQIVRLTQRINELTQG